MISFILFGEVSVVLVILVSVWWTFIFKFISLLCHTQKNSKSV